MRASIVVKSQKCTPSTKRSKVVNVGSVNGTNHLLIRTSACPPLTTTSVATIQHHSHAASSSTINHSIVVHSDSFLKTGHRTMSSLISNHSSTASNQFIPSSVLLGTNTIVNNTNINVTKSTLQEQLVWHQQQQTQIQQQLDVYQKAIDQQLLIVNSFGTAAVSANCSSSSTISNGLNSPNGSGGSGITDLVNQTINFSRNGVYTSNIDSPWPTFGAVIGITSALALGGLYIEHQKSQNQIQKETEINQIEIENVNENNNNDIGSSLSFENESLQSTAMSNDTVFLECNDIDEQLPVVELKENRQQQQQPSSRSGNIRLLSTSPSPELVPDSSTPSSDTIEFVDEYENLPETDEPTVCSACLIFRQGPCRNPWRKFEYCSKNRTGDELIKKCEPYFVQHMACVYQFNNLYTLIRLDQKQNDIDHIEDNTKESERRCWPSSSSTKSIIHIDWGNWPDFVTKEGLNFSQIIDINNETNSTLPLFKRFPEDMNPKLLTGYVSIPCTIDDTDSIKQQDNDYVLTEVWVTDQNGMVLGHEYSKQYMDFVNKQNRLDNDEDDDAQPINDKKEDAQSNNNKDENPDEDSERCTCDFKMIPGCTKQVTVHGIYLAFPPVASQTQEDALQTQEEPVPVPERNVLVYSSKPYCLEKAATEQKNV